MVALRNPVAMVLVCRIFLLTTICVNASAKLDPTSYSLNLTEEVLNSSVPVEQSNGIFSLGTDAWSKNGGRLGNMCDFKTCLSLCCPVGKARLGGICVEDNANFSALPRVKRSLETNEDEEEVTAQHIRLFNDDPCSTSWMTASVVKDYYILANGSIYAPRYRGGSVLDSEHYCLFRRSKSPVYLARVCRPWIQRVDWQIYSLVFSGLIMLAIIISYSIVPELRNLHGIVFRSYMATYIGAHVSVIGQQLTTGSRAYADLFTFFVFSLHYSGGCCSLWLNVMSYNIWRSFRGLRSIDTNIRKEERKKYIWYALYAWITPACFNMITAFIMCYVSYFREYSLNENIILWSCVFLLTTVCICNTILYTSTALTIRRHQKDTSHLTKGVNKHQDVDKQWFNLHVKLFLIMGGHTVFWVIWELWPTPQTSSLMIGIEVIQSILIFFIFVWKDNVRQSLRKQFNDTLSRLQQTFSTNSATPGAEK